MAEEPRDRKSENRHRRGMESPIGAMFELASEIGEEADYAQKMISYTMIFLLFWFGFNVLIIIVVIANGQLIFVPILLGLVIAGLFAIRLEFHIHEFFSYYLRRYWGIKTAYEGMPEGYVPAGLTPVARYLRYLKGTSPRFNQLMESEPDSLQEDAQLEGRSKQVHRFGAYVEKRDGPLSMIPGLGGKGYSLFIRSYGTKPALKDIMELKREVRDITERTGITVGKAVALYVGPKSYDGLSDDLYTYLLEDHSYVKVKRKMYEVIVQVVVETPDGIYDQIPILPVLKDELP